MKKAWARKRKGFTIIELMIVIIVIAILVSISLFSYTKIQQRNRDGQRDRDITEVQRALDKYYAANGVYPSVGSDNTGYALSTLAGALVPTYLSSIPAAPSSQGYSYVRGPASTASYGIRMNYETKANCQRGSNINTGWWGLQACIQ